MYLALILLLGGAIVIVWIYAWTRQHGGVSDVIDLDEVTEDIPIASEGKKVGNGDAVLVSQEQGKLIYANDVARRWLKVNGGTPHLEQVAQFAEPKSNFLELFAAEKQSSFQLGQRWVEASSHRIPVGDGLRIVIVMRELSTAGTDRPEIFDINRAMALINEIGETINAGMGMEQVLQALLTIVGRSIEFDAGEICLWNEQEQVAYQRGWVGDAAYLIALTEAGGVYELDEGITGWIARHHQPVLMRSRRATGILPKLAENPYQSIIGVPLKLGERFIGTFEVASLSSNSYTDADLALLQAVSKTIATTIYNAEIYTEQSRRIDDLANLQQAIKVERDDEDDVAPVYAALNERIADLLSADMSGVFLYDPDRAGLAAQPPFHGLPNALVQTIFIPLAEDSPQRDIWENQQYWVSNDIPDEPLVEALGLRHIVEVAGIANSAWIPLQLGDERIGVLAVSNKRTDGGFTVRDIQNLTVLAAQAAIVVENLRLYQREMRMDTELVGLQEITDAIGTLSHETEFYGEITERIARLMNLEMCGVLLFDEKSNRLVSKLPFYGVPDELVTDYEIQLKPGSVLEELWTEERYWFSNRVLSDPLVFEADLYDLAERVGVTKTMVAVLYASGRRLGVVQVSNKLNGEDFNEGDARLLMIFATQVAAIIENARLYREAQRSAEQAQGLRRVAELAGNVLTSEETFTPVLAEIARLTRSEIVFINVLDQQTGSLVTYPRWVYGVELSEPLTQDIYSEGFQQSVVLSQRPFLSNDVLGAARVLPGYRQIAQRFNIQSAILVPLIFGDRTLGELGVANRRDQLYADEDLEVMRIIASQTAAALDRLLLYEATGENLNRRLEELDAISRVSNELTATLDLDHVLNVIREEAVRATRADGATIVLLKTSDQWTYPDQPEMLRRLGTVAGLSGLADIESQAIMRGADSVTIADYESSSQNPPMRDVRSGVAAAIMYIDQAVGVIHLYHHSPNHFDERSATFSMTMAVKASLGYGNAVRYQEQIERSDRLRRRVEQLNRIFELSHMFQNSNDPNAILEAIAYSVQQSVGYDSVVMTLLDEEAGVLRRTAQAGLPLEAFERSKSNVMDIEQVTQLLKDEYRISESYFFPVEKVADWAVDNIAAVSTEFEGNRTIESSGSDAWRDGDLFVVAMYGASGELIGLMSLDRPHNNKRPDRSTVEVLEIFAHQAATTIENIRLYLSTVRSAEQEAELNEIMEAVSSTLDQVEIVRAVARGAQGIVSFSRMTVALVDAEERGFNVLHVTVQEDETFDIAQEHRMSLGDSALARTYNEGNDHLYRAGDPAIKQYEDLQTWYEASETASIILPLLTGGESLGAIHIGSDEFRDVTGFAERRSLLRRMAQLVASSIQNARLFDQAVNLQVLNRSVVESIQQGIVVLDSSGHIISANEFMRERYDWERDVSGQDLFSYRPQMAEFLAEDLRTVLEDGVPREHINQMSENSDGTLLVTNFYLYPLRYGESIRGAVILVEDVTENALLEQAMEARANQLAALTELSTRITASLERAEVVRVALEEMPWLIPYDAMTLWRRNGSLMDLEGATGQTEIDTLNDEENGGYRFDFGDHELIQQVVESQRVVTVNGADALAEIPIHGDARSWMGVPLVNQGHVVGMMMLTSDESSAYDSKSDQNIAFAFASQVAIALANADLFEQTFDRTNELGILLEAAQATSLTTDLDSVFRTVVELMFSALDMDDCAIMLWDEVDNQLEVQLDMNRRGDADRITPKGARLDLEDHPAKLHSLRDRTVIVITHDETTTPYPQELQELLDNGDTARMLVPLIVREQAIGLIQLEQTREDTEITEQSIRLARALGTQVAVAIENARLSAETTAHFEESLIINDLSRAISSTLDLSDMMNIVRDQLPAMTGARELYLALYEPETEEITFPLAVRGGETYEMQPRELGDDEVSFIIRHRRPLSLGADYFSPDELRRSLGIVNGEGDARSYMGVPLMAGDEVLGVLAVRDTERTRAFTVNEHRLLTTVGAQLGAAIQNARLFRQISSFADDLNRQVEERTRELQDERDRLDTLYQITSELARTLDMDRLMPRALGMVAKAVNAHDGAIMQLDPITDQLYSRAVLNPSVLEENPDGEHATHPAESLARWLIEQDEFVLIIDDLQDQEYWDPTHRGAQAWQSALAVLLETNEELLGVMVLLSRDESAFEESHLRLIVAAANQVAASINNAELYKLIRDQAERLGTLLRAEQEEAEKSNAILEGIADGVVLADSEGEIILYNSAAERILQVPRDQAMGQSLSQVTGIHGGTAAKWAQTIEERVANFEGELPGEYIDERLELGNRVVSVHLSPVYTGERFLGTVSVFRDITRDVEVDRMKSEFVSNVSHEFRTPLTPIKGYTDLLLMGAAGVVTDEQKQFLGTIKDNVGRLAALVEDVLNISQIDSGRERLKLEMVDVPNVIETVLIALNERQRHREKDLAVNFQPPVDLPVIQADPEKLRRILSNVIGNAFNYTPAGGTIDIEVWENPDRRRVVIDIADTGVGIPEDFHDKIWRRFERHEETALHLDDAGTGLGMPIVKELVEMHGGEIWFDSVVGEGTTFHIALPIKQPEYLVTAAGMPSSSRSN